MAMQPPIRHLEPEPVFLQIDAAAVAANVCLRAVNCSGVEHGGASCSRLIPFIPVRAGSAIGNRCDSCCRYRSNEIACGDSGF